jgi:hypothetical protein
MLLAKINNLVESSNTKVDRLAAELGLCLACLECANPAWDISAAQGGRFTTAKQVAYIHECATDNMDGHNLSQPTTYHAHPQANTVGDPNELVDSDMLPPDTASPLATAHISAALPCQAKPCKQPDCQALAKPSYVTMANKENTWHTVPARKGRARQMGPHPAQGNPTSQLPLPNQLSKLPQPPRPVPRPETLCTEITVQRPPGCVVTGLSDVSLICRHVVVALQAAKSELLLLSGRWATHMHNYVYTFARNVLFTKITQVAHILLQPFLNRVLAPCTG